MKMSEKSQVADLKLVNVVSSLDLEVACYKYEGVDAVKNALRAGLDLSTEDMPIKVRERQIGVDQCIAKLVNKRRLVPL